jgi:hypothetical protein
MKLTPSSYGTAFRVNIETDELEIQIQCTAMHFALKFSLTCRKRFEARVIIINYN